MSKLTLLLILACIAPAAFAQLAWKSKEQEVTATLGQKSISAIYVFQNKGQHPVNVLDVKTSCGCTTAKMAKKTYAPGEKGEIEAELTIGEQMGFQEKMITVLTDDPQLPNAVLILKAHLPIILDIQPNAVTWELGDSPSPKSIKLKADPSLPVKVLSVFCDSMDIDTALKVDKEGQEYTIVVTPSGTKIQARGNILISTDYKQNGKSRNFNAFAAIVPKVAPPTPVQK